MPLAVSCGFCFVFVLGRSGSNSNRQKAETELLQFVCGLTVTVALLSIYREERCGEYGAEELKEAGDHVKRRTVIVAAIPAVLWLLFKTRRNF